MENENKVQAKDAEIDLEKNGKDVAGGRIALTVSYVDIKDQSVELSLEADNAFAVVGRSGAGKTTIVNLPVHNAETDLVFYK